jgi:hypothetical protein
MVTLSLIFTRNIAPWWNVTIPYRLSLCSYSHFIAGKVITQYCTDPGRVD